MNDFFHLKVISRDATVFDDDVLSITSYNDKGKFDILKNHSNFISLIYKSVEIIKKGGDKQIINITKALLKNKENSTEIYIGVDNI